MSYYTPDELARLGFAAVGKNVNISRKASLYGVERITIGDHVRIDDFCVLSAGTGGIEIGSYVHIAVFSLLIGKARITLEDFSGLASRVAIYSSNDDYSGKWMTNPCVPEQYTNVKHAPVRLEQHAIVGSGSTLLPGVTIEKGAVVGAHSLVKKTCREFGVYFGNPAKKVADRSRDLLDLESEFLKQC